MEFTFGPRHRVVTRTVRGVWLRAFLSVLVGIVLGVMLLAALGILTPTRAHAAGLDQTAELKAAAERLNSTCRDDPKAVGACVTRDAVLSQLRAAGHCWNAKAPTPATLWQPCTTQAVAAPALCTVWADVAYSLAMQRDAGIVPQVAYGAAVSTARRSGMDPAPLQALTWRVYAEQGRMLPAAIRHEQAYECRAARGVL